MANVWRRRRFPFFAGAALALAAACAGENSSAGLLLDLRFADGSTNKSVSAGDVGTEIPIQVWAKIDSTGGVDGSGAQYGLQFLAYSLVSARVGGGLNGALTSPQLTVPFTGAGAQLGQLQDLNADGIVDLGSLAAASDKNVARPRAIPPGVFNTSAAGQTQNILLGPGNVVIGVEFLVETLKFRVDAATTGQSTRFDVAIPSWITGGVPYGANWWQKSTGAAANGLNNGAYLAGSSVLFTGAAIGTGSEWSLNGSGNWSNAANWIGGVPNAVDAVANFKSIPTGPVTVTVDAPQTVGVMNFQNANAYTIAGASSVTLNAAASAAINVAQGAHTVSAPLTLAQATALNTNGGNLTLSGPLGNSAGKAITKSGAAVLSINGPQTHGAGASLTASAGTTNLGSDAGSNLAVNVGGGITTTLNLNATQHLGPLSVQAGAKVNIAQSAVHPPYAPGNKYVQTKGLTVDTASGSSLDVNDNVLIVDYTGGANPAGAIANLLTQGFNVAGTIWDGPGIKSSSARDDAAGLSSLGMIDNADIGYDHISGNQFNFGGPGDAIPAQSVLVKYTYGGDTDLNGVVDGDDLVSFNVGYLNNLSGWSNGDFDYSGVVDGDDLTVLLVSYNQTHGGPYTGQVLSDGGVRAVPEPGTLALAALGALGLALAARRRK